jgi:hypothetical protein
MSADVTPFSRWFPDAPSFDYTNLYVFGCQCLAHVEKSQRSSRLASKARLCIFLGYSADHKGFLVLSVDTLSLLIRRDVRFDETRLFRDLNPMPAMSVVMATPVSEEAGSDDEYFQRSLFLSPTAGDSIGVSDGVPAYPVIDTTASYCCV